MSRSRVSLNNVQVKGHKYHNSGQCAVMKVSYMMNKTNHPEEEHLGTSIMVPCITGSSGQKSLSTDMDNTL